MADSEGSWARKRHKKLQANKPPCQRFCWEMWAESRRSNDF
jgi:hypothetical protein